MKNSFSSTAQHVLLAFCKECLDAMVPAHSQGPHPSGQGPRNSTEWCILIHRAQCTCACTDTYPFFYAAQKPQLGWFLYSLQHEDNDYIRTNQR